MKSSFQVIFNSRMTSRIALVLCLIFATNIYLIEPCSGQQLSGDKQALDLVERMFQTIGGTSAWEKAQSIYVELKGFYAREEEPWDEVFWMSLNQPFGKFILKRPTGDQIIAWTPKGGWDQQGDKVNLIDSTRHVFELAYWKRQALVVFHRLASRTPLSRVEIGDDQFSFNVYDQSSNDFIASFVLNKKGEPIKWSSKIGDQEFQHVFGPMQSFGNVNQPSWGATPSGVWRYEHQKITLSDEFPPVTFETPSNKK